MKIVLTEINDLDFCCELFDEAIAYQKRMGYPQYVSADREGQKNCILQQNHFKVVVNDQIAAVFNLQFSDSLIWRELDKGNSVYLHGVLINPAFKGNRIFGHIMDYSIAYALCYQRHEIRLDTWYDNPPLTSYYQTFGFSLLESYQIPDSSQIPLNCRGNKVALMEYRLPRIKSYRKSEIEHVLSGYASRSLKEEEWTHHAHLMVALNRCLHQGAKDALHMMRQEISALNVSLGGINDETRGYHESITRFWVNRTMNFIYQHSFDSFQTYCNAYISSHMGHPRSPWWFYQSKTLEDSVARTSWVQSDRYPIPYIEK